MSRIKKNHKKLHNDPLTPNAVDQLKYGRCWTFVSLVFSGATTSM